jgi:hypothetical protein
VDGPTALCLQPIAELDSAMWVQPSRARTGRGGAGAGRAVRLLAAAGAPVCEPGRGVAASGGPGGRRGVHGQGPGPARGRCPGACPLSLRTIYCAWDITVPVIPVRKGRFALISSSCYCRVEGAAFLRVDRDGQDAAPSQPALRWPGCG